MISFSQQQQIYSDLSGNTSSTNLSRGAYLANIEHRYLLQKYFSNEASFQISTVGQQQLTLTSAPQLGATSATLTYQWTYPTATMDAYFSDGEKRGITFTNGSTAITWNVGLVGQQPLLTTGLVTGATSATLNSAWQATSGAYLTQFGDGEQYSVTYTNGSTAITWSTPLVGPVSDIIIVTEVTTALTAGGQQTYNLPSDYSKLKTGTVTIGSLKWTPTEILSRQQWDSLNVFPYYADIPDKFFIYKNQFHLWPIPATTGNVISFNYKRRVPDLSLVDVTGSGNGGAGNITVANGGYTITGSGTSWVPTSNGVSESRWIQIAQPAGDNLWYQIAEINSTTLITLYQPYQGIAVSGATSFTIGQMPLLEEDFQDMLIWKPLAMYYSSAVGNDKVKAAGYQEEYDRKLELLEEYCGSKTINVNLSRRPQMRNPNLFNQSFGN